jgi:hypothetical protein
MEPRIQDTIGEAHAIGLVEIGETAINTIGGARAVSLVGIGAIALVLIVNSVGGKIQPRASIFEAQPSSHQIVSSAAVETLQVASVDPIAESPREEPRPKVTLSRDQVGEVQAWLKAYAIHPGPVDGIAGPRTISATKTFQSAHQLPQTGNIDYALLDALRRASGLPLR